MDPGLAPEFGRDRDDRQTAGLVAAVAAALAHALVDPHALRRRRQLAPLAQAALLGRAAVGVDQDRDPVDAFELDQRVLELGAIAHRDAWRQRRAVKRSDVLGGDDHPLDALGLQPVGQLGNAHPAGRRLPTGHRDRVVVQQPERDLAAGGDGGSDRQRARVMERAVAHVLDVVTVGGERRHAEPLRALAAHLWRPEDLSAASGPIDPDQRVAADPGADELVCRGPRREVVRAARAEERRPRGRQRRQLGAGPHALTRAGDAFGAVIRAAGRRTLAPAPAPPGRRRPCPTARSARGRRRRACRAPGAGRSTPYSRSRS